MILLRTPRNYAQCVVQKFFPYFNLQKQTRLNNIAHLSIQSQEYLALVVVNCLLSEIEEIIEKKLINTKSENITLKLSDAQGVLLYKILLAHPIDEREVYQQLVRSHWVEKLDGRMIMKQIYMHNQPVTPAPPKRSLADYLDE